MKAVESKPDSPEAWNILGEITIALGRLEESQVFLEKALQIDRHDITIILTLCELSLKKGDIESHVKYCDELLKELDLSRDRKIDSFKDIKSIFIEVEKALNKDKKYSNRIRNIVSLLPLDKNRCQEQEMII
jgi:tetratricopeptide (TPR) repeat protein